MYIVRILGCHVPAKAAVWLYRYIDTFKYCTSSVQA